MPTILNGYIDRFNEQFGIEPKESQSAFRPLDDSVDLSAILCVKEQRRFPTGAVSRTAASITN